MISGLIGKNVNVNLLFRFAIGLYWIIINFRTCLYVGAAVFIREFHGSLLLYDESQKLGSIGTEEKIYLNADKSPKTANFNFSKIKFVFY